VQAGLKLHNVAVLRVLPESVDVWNGGGGV